MDSLSTAERETLAQFQAITNSTNDESSIQALRAVEWDLQVRRRRAFVGRRGRLGTAGLVDC